MKQSVTRGLGAVSGLMLLLTGVAIAGPSNRGPKPSHPRPLSGFGSPLPAVLRNPADEKIFATGQANFKEDDGIPQLGPIFNGHTSCAGCHFQGAVGGGAAINEIRVRANQQAGPVHLFAVDNATFHEPASPGCSVATSDCDLSPCQQQEEDATTFTATLPACDPGSSDYLSGGNCQAERRTIPTFGDGLVEAVDDATLEDLAQQEPPALRGSVKFVTEDGASRVARFGWKDDHATLRAFAGDAYLNEMGVTNPDHQSEVSECAVDDDGLETPLADEPEDPTDPDGRADIDRFADFMRGLNPPPPLRTLQGPGSPPAMLFGQIGCAGCHTPSLTTSSNPAAFIPLTTGGVPISRTLNHALAGQTFHPFSDYLLHDMGALGDGIVSGSAGATMMRTAPLWGISVRTTFLHDGRARTIAEAITMHDGQGRASAEAFQNLSPKDKKALVQFVKSL